MRGDGERVELLQQWAGYLLTNALKHQKFLLIAGEGGNGKTVFATILEKMVSEENVSHIPLCCFGDRFALHYSLGKMLNSTSESSHGLDELCETMLKSYTSGDRMTFERKFREPISAKPTAKVMISTNQLPNFTDKSNGIWRRMLFVPFDKGVPIDEQNPELVSELFIELPGIFNWVYEGLRKLAAEGRFIEPTRCKEAIGEYRRDTNPARVFLEENYIEGFEFDGTPCGEVYQSYVVWCGQNGYHPLNSSNFGKEVKRAFPGVERTRKRTCGSRDWIYVGLAVREDSCVATGKFGRY
jgi:putative DNA primase/helicase